MQFLGNFSLGFNQTQRQTIDITSAIAKKISNGTLIKGTPSAPAICETFADIDETLLGMVMIQPQGTTLTNGQKIDIVCGTIRIDVKAYENERNEETDSTKCDLSTIKTNVALTGTGCMLELVQVLR